MSEEDYLRLPPQAIEAEQSILGSMMLDSNLADEIGSMLDIEDFYRNDHKTLFRTIGEMSSAGQSVDIITVSEKLMETGEASEVGGLVYLNTLVKNTPQSGNIKSYASVVRRRAIARKVIETCNHSIEMAYRSNGGGIEDIITEHMTDIGTLTAEKYKSSNYGVGEVLQMGLDAIEEKMKRGDSLIGFSTGIKAFDDRINGQQKGKLVVIAGRPSMGKTTFAMNMCEAAASEGAVVKIFTMEMPNEEIGGKLLSSQGMVDYGKINRPNSLVTDDWPKMTSSVTRMKDWEMFIDDSSGVTIEKIASECRRCKKDHGLDIVMIDYLQLMQYPKAERNDLAVGAVTKALKNLSKELGIEIILLSQLNRSLENRPNKRPVMSDLRESGSIEQDADVITFIYREEMYDPTTEFKGVAEVITRKNRQGQLGTDTVRFAGEFQRFEDFKKAYD